jgi:tRNA pseudouridine38-40 synthase
MLGHFARLHPSGRTDAGVHARGMVATFTSDTTLPLRAFSHGLNAFLPPDIVIRAVDEVPLDFRVRYDASGKHYRYTIYNGAPRSPLARLYSWQVREPLLVDAMVAAATLFVGEHDFASFRTSGCAAKTTLRRISACDLKREADLLVIDVLGSGFLRNMVRLMVGSLVEVGRNRCSIADISRLLVEPGRHRPPLSAPPQGLCLMEVFYPPCRGDENSP